VIAIDADPAAIRRLSALGLSNVEAHVAEAEAYDYCRGCADVIFLGNVLHDFRDPRLALARMRRALKPTGVLADLDWVRAATEQGPPLEKRMPPERAARLMMDAGYDVTRKEPVGSTHYLLLGRARPAQG
jgi:SAM-dependent methyltransferase